jgi:hypothetical protein
MEPISIKPFKPLNPSSSFIRIGDLVYFEGPLRTLFTDARNKRLYIFDWVDNDEATNRWLVYSIAPKDLLLYLQRSISYFELFKNAINKKYYITDISSAFVTKYYKLHEISELPEKYLPNEDDYFDKGDTIFYDKIQALLIEHLTNQKQENEYLKTSVKFKWIERRKTSTNRFTNLGFVKSVEHGASLMHGRKQHVNVEMHNTYYRNKLTPFRKASKLQKINKNDYSRTG